MTKGTILLAALPFMLTACGDAASDTDADTGETELEEEHSVAGDQPYGPVVREVDPEVEAAGAGDETRANAGALQDTIPEKFHGDWSESLDHCGSPGHQRYDIRASEVGFFESRGIVQNVRADGDYAAATLSEQYGDAPPAIYVFYMAIEDENTMRIRYDDNPRFRIYRCP